MLSVCLEFYIQHIPSWKLKDISHVQLTIILVLSLEGLKPYLKMLMNAIN